MKREASNPSPSSRKLPSFLKVRLSSSTKSLSQGNIRSSQLKHRSFRARASRHSNRAREVFFSRAKGGDVSKFPISFARFSLVLQLVEVENSISSGMWSSDFWQRERLAGGRAPAPPSPEERSPYCLYGPVESVRVVRRRFKGFTFGSRGDAYHSRAFEQTGRRVHDGVYAPHHQRVGRRL